MRNIVYTSALQAMNGLFSMFAGQPTGSRSTFTAKRRQTEESKAFYMERAVAKRERKARILNARADAGAIGRVVNDINTFLGQAYEQVKDHPVEIIGIPVVELSEGLKFDIEIGTKTVAELRELAKERGLKFTTKTTKTQLVEMLTDAAV